MVCGGTGNSVWSSRLAGNAPLPFTTFFEHWSAMVKYLCYQFSHWSKADWPRHYQWPKVRAHTPANLWTCKGVGLLARIETQSWLQAIWFGRPKSLRLKVFSNITIRWPAHLAWRKSREQAWSQDGNSLTVEPVIRELAEEMTSAHGFSKIKQ